jgi:hypothetical protein
VQHGSVWFLAGQSGGTTCLPRALFLENSLGLSALVGAAGFEPTTPSPPDWCANRAAPRPDRNGGDYRTVRACCFD